MSKMSVLYDQVSLLESIFKVKGNKGIMGSAKIIFYELILLISSVFIFRSLWIFLDQFSFFSEGLGLGILMIAGFLGIIISLLKLNKKERT